MKKFASVQNNEEPLKKDNKRSVSNFEELDSEKKRLEEYYARLENNLPDTML